MKQYDLDQIENFGRIWTDRFAKDRGWENHELRDPIDDLALFFTHLSGTTVLDIGCGWGRYVYRFLDHGLVYQGIDNSAEMLNIARQSNPATTFIEGSFRALPFPSNYFDGLWSCCSLSAVPKANLVKILKEHVRVMKQGAVMMVVMPEPPISQEMMYTDEKGIPEIYQAHYHLDEFIEHVLKTGLEIIESDHRYQHGSFYLLTRKPN